MDSLRFKDRESDVFFPLLFNNVWLSERLIRDVKRPIAQRKRQYTMNSLLIEDNIDVIAVQDTKPLCGEQI